MRNATLTFLFALLGPIGFGATACFLTTDGETYDYDSWGYGSGGSDCPVGDPGCACTSTGVCNDGFTCNPMLNLCIHDGCAVGSKGCPCTQGGACDEALTCLEGYCVAGPCPPELTGTESCQCTDGGGCDPGLSCLSNVCVNPGDATAGNEPATTTGGTTSTEETTSVGRVDGGSADAGEETAGVDGGGTTGGGAA